MIGFYRYAMRRAKGASRGERRLARRTPQFKTAVFPGAAGIEAGADVTVWVAAAHSLTQTPFAKSVYL
jgi:hypothetical protein